LNSKGAKEKPDQILIEKAINQVFETKDSYVAVVPLFRHNLLQKISNAIGIPDLTSDSRFNTIENMVQNNKELNEIIQKAFLSKTTEEWIPILETNDILCAQINEPTQAFSDPQVLENEMVQDIKVHKEDEIKIIGTPIKLNETPGSIRRAPPLLGQHTDEILKEVGYNPLQISELRKNRIVS
jgi:crotonobetainyl-CoA:carnitine CoA-transferase CaiB-like acyl-CoA transferase